MSMGPWYWVVSGGRTRRDSCHPPARTRHPIPRCRRYLRVIDQPPPVWFDVVTEISPGRSNYEPHPAGPIPGSGDRSSGRRGTRRPPGLSSPMTSRREAWLRRPPDCQSAGASAPASPHPLKEITMRAESHHTRRHVLGAGVLALAATPLGLAGLTKGAPTMSTQATPASSTEFKPLKQVNAGVLNVGYAEDGPGGRYAGDPAARLALRYSQLRRRGAAAGRRRGTGSSCPTCAATATRASSRTDTVAMASKRRWPSTSSR